MSAESDNELITIFSILLYRIIIESKLHYCHMLLVFKYLSFLNLSLDLHICILTTLRHNIDAGIILSVSILISCAHNIHFCKMLFQNTTIARNLHMMMDFKVYVRIVQMSQVYLLLYYCCNKILKTTLI